MKCRLISLLVLLCSSVYGAVPAGGQGAAASRGERPTDNTYDLVSFSSELHRLSDALQRKPSPNEIRLLRDSLPQSWTVLTPNRKYSISTKSLRTQLNPSSTEKAQAWIGYMQAEVEGSRTYGADIGTARSELDHILAGPEFAAVHPPSAWEVIRQRMAAWLQRMLLKILGGMGRHPIGGEILFWLLLIGGVAFVALWTFRFLTSRDGMDSLKAGASVVTSRTWQEWIREARQAANRGDFREAVHSTYWAGIVRLEDTGALPRDRTRTPREYLELVTESGSKSDSAGAGSQRNRREPLIGLTSRLERIWYANRDARSEDFHDSLRQLEELGCPLE